MKRFSNDSSRRSGDEVCAAVIEEVAATVGKPPLDLDQQLNDVVDPDALARLFDARDDSTGRVAFTFAGCRVEVTSGGEVSATSVDDDPSARLVEPRQN